MSRIAVPIFQKRISPVLDCCERLLVIDIDQESEIERKDLFLDDMSLSDRLNMLQRLGVAVVICGGISETMYTMLQCCGIESIPGISGDVDDVICAFCHNRLKDSKFTMPGCKNSD
jgi:predicted Fe-Mo cluster-binding NifX family protein